MPTMDIDVNVRLRDLKLLGMGAEAVEVAINRGVFQGQMMGLIEATLMEHPVDERRQMAVQIAAAALYYGEGGE